MPVIAKFNDKETVESISEKIEESVFQRIKPNLNRIGLIDFPKEIVLLALKEERILQVYTKVNDSLVHLKSYPFKGFSGKLGPKLKEGDKQIPEGVYSIEYLNPNSSYYLSMKVSYPNEFDVSKSRFENKNELGNDIFIHGKSATIGCIPLGDEGIEELFILAENAFQKNIKVIIAPRDFRVNNVFPRIIEIDWENELYEIIKREIFTLPNSDLI